MSSTTGMCPLISAPSGVFQASRRWCAHAKNLEGFFKARQARTSAVGARPTGRAAKAPAQSAAGGIPRRRADMQADVEDTSMRVIQRAAEGEGSKAEGRGVGGRRDERGEGLRGIDFARRRIGLTRLHGELAKTRGSAR